MKNLIFIGSTFAVFSLLLGSCRERIEDTRPDLTSALTGRFAVTYHVTDFKGLPPLTGDPGTDSYMQWERKDNSTLTVLVKITDDPVRVNDQFELAVSPVDPSKDMLLKPGLRSIYSLTGENLDRSGTNVGHVNLYKDGKLRGGIAYINKNGQLVSLLIKE